MKNTKKNWTLLIGRFAIGGTMGYAWKRVYATVAEGKRPLEKVLIAIGTFAGMYGSAHALDLWFNKNLPYEEEHEWCSGEGNEETVEE